MQAMLNSFAKHRFANHNRILRNETLHIISAEWLHANLDAVKTIDVSFSLADADFGINTFLAGHIAHAHYIHLEHGLSDMSRTQTHGRHPLPKPEQFARTLASCGLQRDDKIVCYDQDSGAYAARAWWLLRAAGFKNVYVLDGGLNAWRAANFPLSTEIAPFSSDAPEALNFNAMPQIDSESLQAALSNQAKILVDARPANRFAGRDETLDAIAGHVPGAYNRPFSENMQNGRFKSSDVLRSEFLALLGDKTTDQAVMMCGSGVTACHNLLAMAAAGLEGAALYAPSWSGWIIDHERPIANDSMASLLGQNHA